jgi:hypothetical protein
MISNARRTRLNPKRTEVDAVLGRIAVVVGNDGSSAKAAKYGLVEEQRLVSIRQIIPKRDHGSHGLD